MTDHTESAENPQSAPAGSPVLPVSRISSRRLLGDAREIRIEHQGQIYRLCCTRNGKLILTK